jgi:hypothetical protein
MAIINEFVKPNREKSGRIGSLFSGLDIVNPKNRS